jgi:hypothetical protein
MQQNYNSIYSSAIGSGYIPSALGGVSPSVFTNFVDQYFNRANMADTQDLSTFTNAWGNIFGVGIYRKYSSSVSTSTLHAIVITGVSADGSQYYYKDPQNGGMHFYVDVN